MCFIAIRRHYVISRPLHSIASPPSNIIPLSTIAICALLFNASKWAEFRWFWYSDPSTKRYVLIHEYSQLANNAFYILVVRLFAILFDYIIMNRMKFCDNFIFKQKYLISSYLISKIP